MDSYDMGQQSSSAGGENSASSLGSSQLEYEHGIPQSNPPYSNPLAEAFPFSQAWQPANTTYEGGHGVPLDPLASSWCGFYPPCKGCARGCGNPVAVHEYSDICLACRGIKKCAGKCPKTLSSQDPVELCLSCRVMKPCGISGCPSMIFSSHGWEFCDLCTRSCASGCGAPVARGIFCERCEFDALRQTADQC